MTRPSSGHWQQRAIAHVEERLGNDGPREQRVIHCEAREDWDVGLLRNTSHHDLHVLGRSTDLVVYFDGDGAFLGWRDDGRTGSEMPTEVDRAVLFARLRNELDLPKTAVLGECKPDKLAHVGWTHRVAVFLEPRPRPEQVLRAWVDPKSLKTIQCLRRAGVPVESEDTGTFATEEVRKLLSRRIEHAGSPEIWRSRPEWYFQVEPGESREYEGGTETRIHTWRHWSSASVTFDVDSGAVLADLVERFAAPPAESLLKEEDARAAIAESVEIPADSRLESFEHHEFAPGHRLAKVLWLRVRGDLPVEGDYLEICLHPDTKRIVRYDRKWRDLEPPSKPATMTKPEAIRLTEAQRNKLDLDPDMNYSEARKAIVEHKKDRLVPGRTEDHVAWIVTYTSAEGWAEVHVDAARRKVLTVLRSA